MVTSTPLLTTDVSTETTSETKGSITTLKSTETSITTLTNDFSEEADQNQQSSFGAGDILAVVLSLVLITVAVVLILLFGFYLKKRRQHSNAVLKPAFGEI